MFYYIAMYNNKNHIIIEHDGKTTKILEGEIINQIKIISIKVLYYIEYYKTDCTNHNLVQIIYQECNNKYYCNLKDFIDLINI